jgi:carboxyl-terminal processing protease
MDRDPMKRNVILLPLLLLVVFLFPSKKEDEWTDSLDKLSSLMTLIESHYFQDIDTETLTYSSIQGMLQTLDPHSHFLDPRHFLRLREEYKGKYYGLGIMIQKQEDRLVVISPIEGGPASRLGIQAGDIISHIEGESTKEISSTEAMMRLRGPKGTEVNITIVRDGLEEPLDLTIVREEIPLHSVPYAFMLGDGIGYIFIRNFAESTTTEFEEKMKLLTEKGMKNLILDMRGNTGGTFAQSIEISDEFLPKGAGVVSILGRKKYYNKEFRASRNDQHEDIPLVILINQGSASAPEIVSGAIKDNDRGLIVGDDSWGKGLVQTVFPLAPDAAVALTTARYYTPSGRSIQRDYSSFEDYYIFKREPPEEQREVKFTEKGRKVFGQGGISPDYKVSFSYTALTSKLFSKGAFFSYATRFTNKKRPVSRDTVSSHETEEGRAVQRELADDLVVGALILDDFKNYLKENNIDFKDEEFGNAEKEIARELEREIVSSLWGIEQGLRAYRKTDPVILKAIEVLPEANALVKKASH